MEIKDKFDYIKLGIVYSEIVRTTLGPKGMNKMITENGSGKLILTNDGATIIKNVKLDNPIGELFKKLAVSQEEAVGDGTTTSLVLAGQLLQNALDLINKGLHPTTIINGYSMAKIYALKFLEEIKESVNKEKIIRTAFGSKINKQVIDHLIPILMKIKDFRDIRIYKMENTNPEETKLIRGYAFDGFTINERMKKSVKGKIAFLDLKSNLTTDKLSINTSDELFKIEKGIKDYMKKIVSKLKKDGVKCVFYTDTNPQFESYLTNSGITGVVIFKRDEIDYICKALNCRVIADEEVDFKDYISEAEIIYEKNPNRIIILNDKSQIQTLLICGQTMQILSEIERSIDDVIRILRHSIEAVVGAGAVEIEISNHLREISQQIGGKEQIAFEKFAESIESIPRIIAENAGLDSWEILTMLKTMHKKGEKDMGVDILKLVSNARERGIFEPALVKQHAISSACDVANLILKLDQILIGENEDK